MIHQQERRKKRPNPIKYVLTEDGLVFDYRERRLCNGRELIDILIPLLQTKMDATAMAVAANFDVDIDYDFIQTAADLNPPEPVTTPSPKPVTTKKIKPVNIDVFELSMLARMHLSIAELAQRFDITPDQVVMELSKFYNIPVVQSRAKELSDDERYQIASLVNRGMHATVIGIWFDINQGLVGQC